jgi:hypothetical protein
MKRILMAATQPFYPVRLPRKTTSELIRTLREAARKLNAPEFAQAATYLRRIERLREALTETPLSVIDCQVVSNIIDGKRRT